jgi:5-methylcytosine-specific restriction enzyme subunit McrC
LALLFDMNALWEDYVAALLRRAAPAQVTVSSQHSRVFWRSTGSGRTLRPDLIVGRRDEAVPRAVIDTKWKVPPHGRPSSGDLKQMFAYNELFGCRRSVLLYPRGDVLQESVLGVFQVGGHTCETRYVSAVDGHVKAHLAELLGELVGPVEGELPQPSGGRAREASRPA